MANKDPFAKVKKDPKTSGRQQSSAPVVEVETKVRRKKMGRPEDFPGVQTDYIKAKIPVDNVLRLKTHLIRSEFSTINQLVNAAIEEYLRNHDPKNKSKG